MYSLILCGGRRSLDLQKWRNLRVSVKLSQNAFAFSNSFSSADVSSLQDGRKGQNFTVSYLVESLGLTTKLAESISKKVTFEDKRNPDSVLSLLISHGFTESQISTIVTEYPLLLKADAEKSLGPKLQLLLSRGASSSELTEIVSKVPKILGKREGKTISSYYDFFKDIIRADKSFDKLCHSSSQEGSKQDNKIRNVSLLRELGMPQRLLFSVLISNSNVCCGKEKFEKSLKKVVEMGFDLNSARFVEALCVVQSLSEETIQEKVNVYKKLGFDVGETWEIFKKWPTSMKTSEKKILKSVETFLGLGFSRDEFMMMVKGHPSCIGLSAESVKKKIEFLVEKMNWPLKSVVSEPRVIVYSMEKRIVPRCEVIKALMSKGLLRKGSELPPLSSVLVCTDEAFLNRYVRKHDDDKELVAELIALFNRDRISL